MISLRLLLVIVALAALTVSIVNYVSVHVISPLALATNLQPLFLAAALCIPISFVSQKLKHS